MAILQTRKVARKFPVKRTLIDVALRRPQAFLHAVRGVDLSVAPGETLGIVGESGCGKSTLARLMVGLHACDAGTVELHDKAMAGPDPRGRIQMVFQDPYSSLNPRMTVGALLDEAIAHFRPGLSKQTRHAEIAEILGKVGLARETAGKYPHALSGGQRQRVSIARALCPRPEVLVADEPVSALDASVQAQIINLFEQLKRDDGITIVFISHDMQVVAHLCDRVAVMYLGEIVELQPTELLFAAPLHPYTQGLIAAVPTIDGRRKDAGPSIAGEMPDPFAELEGCRFAGRCPLVEARCTARQDLRQVSEGSAVRCWKAVRFGKEDERDDVL